MCERQRLERGAERDAREEGERSVDFKRKWANIKGDPLPACLDPVLK